MSHLEPGAQRRDFIPHLEPSAPLLTGTRKTILFVLFALPVLYFAFDWFSYKKLDGGKMAPVVAEVFKGHASQSSTTNSVAPRDGRGDGTTATSSASTSPLHFSRGRFLPLLAADCFPAP